LSRVGRLLLVKSVLEAIPIYQMSLAWIPKGTLDKIIKLCFKLLWEGSQDKFVLPWVKWETLAIPKALGGWGLKNIFLFSKALATKSSWKLISYENLWTQVVSQKYIHLDSIEDWIRRLVKDCLNCSIIWKALLKPFLVIGDRLAWRIGKGSKVRIDIDPWPGSGHSRILLDDVKGELHTNGDLFLNQIVDPTHSSLWKQEWKSHTKFGLNDVS
jgi:hypothetical protein